MSLPASGSLSIKSAAGVGRSISQDVDNNETGNKSLTTLSTTVGKGSPHSALEFYGFAWGVPPTPTGVTATDVGASIQITWSHGASNGNPIHSYRIERESSSDPGVWNFVNTVDGSSTSINDTPANGQYIYRVRAENTGATSSWVNSNSVIGP